ncbi:hypothetical protein J2Z19_003242 [Ensifer adhaerens]|uniref:Uncharacterized protein n=1 Tax=Ensifer adhaerens TaxID=106592 RepID=A0ACC5SXE6_ENSAD|nr:CHC2 zinc finger domain-containing protein [Ensifer adhaerens]MBP1873527.1 hypothetical protein [Ensifer adhaerens]
MNHQLDDFIARAKMVTVTAAAETFGFQLGAAEYSGPCPRCNQGKDRFSIHPGKQAFNCRSCGGGRDGIGFMAHVHHLDLKSRTDFLEACSAALGEPIPEGGERETDEERAERLARLAALKAQAEEKARETERKQAEFRERDIRKARAIYSNAFSDADDVRQYLKLRTGYVVSDEMLRTLRGRDSHTYYVKDEYGRGAERHCGPAMIGAFVTLEGEVTGCHQTWIDLHNAPKHRPNLGVDDKGRVLPTKKMLGSKRGSFIPCLGSTHRTRWVGGEGIENVVAIAGFEGFRADTFYFATGDLGNLAGPAESSSEFKHPHHTKKSSDGRTLTINVPGPVPKVDQGPRDAFQVADHVTDLVLIADGDSEFYMTASAMARGKTRLSREGRSIDIWWPPEGMDFAGLLSAQNSRG